MSVFSPFACGVPGFRKFLALTTFRNSSLKYQFFGVPDGTTFIRIFMVVQGFVFTGSYNTSTYRVILERSELPASLFSGAIFISAHSRN
jgi:hypothetical protein